MQHGSITGLYRMIEDVREGSSVSFYSVYRVRVRGKVYVMLDMVSLG